MSKDWQKESSACAKEATENAEIVALEAWMQREWGHVDRDTLGYRTAVEVWLASAANHHANVAQGAEADDECPASGQSCSYAPEGRRGEMQCRYCGKPQTALTDADLRTAVWQIAAIDTSFETEIRDGMKILRDLLDAAQSASGDAT